MPPEPHPLSLDDTLKRMEPGLSVPSVEQSLASIAISLKRLADIQDFRPSHPVDLTNIISALNGVRMAIDNHSTKVVLPR